MNSYFFDFVPQFFFITPLSYPVFIKSPAKATDYWYHNKNHQPTRPCNIKLTQLYRQQLFNVTANKWYWNLAQLFNVLLTIINGLPDRMRQKGFELPPQNRNKQDAAKILNNSTRTQTFLLQQKASLAYGYQCHYYHRRHACAQVTPSSENCIINGKAEAQQIRAIDLQTHHTHVKPRKITGICLLRQQLRVWHTNPPILTHEHSEYWYLEMLHDRGATTIAKTDISRHTVSFIKASIPLHFLEYLLLTAVCLLLQHITLSLEFYSIACT